MKGFFAAPFVVLALSCLSLDALAQSSMQPPPYGDYPAHVMPEKSAEEEYNDELRYRTSPSALREDRVLKKGLLAPSESDRAAFTAFLRTRHTGLLRLLRPGVHDRQISSSKKLRNVRGGGAYYSFAGLTHAYGYGSDIKLDYDKLSVGFAGADFGMLTRLGDVPLEKITLADPRAQFISNYKAPKRESEARAEAHRFNLGGVTIDGLNYQRSLPVQVNATYLLRSIVYRRSDVLVALRVVREDQDGSVIIAWERLKKYSVPQLKQRN